jgi:hypothetical protein
VRQHQIGHSKQAIAESNRASYFLQRQDVESACVVVSVRGQCPWLWLRPAVSR